MGGVRKAVAKKAKSILLGEMGFTKDGGNINWFPGHMAAATKAIRNRLKVSDLVIEVRDARLPMSSANQDLQPMLAGKRKVIALNKKDLANPNLMPKWIHHFNSCKQDCLPINAHDQSCVQKLLDLVEFKLKEAISREPTLLVMVVGVPNVGKSALINSIHRIASFRFPVQGRLKRATVGPLPGVTQDIAGYKIAHRPSIYVLDSPGVLVPSIADVETGLKLALAGSVKDSVVGEERIAQYLLAVLIRVLKHAHAGSVKDSVVGEERIAQYLLAVLNTRGTPFHWKNLFRTETEDILLDTTTTPTYDLKDLLLKKGNKKKNRSDALYIEDYATRVKRALYTTLAEFNGSLENENDLEILIEQQFDKLQTALKVPDKGSEARTMVSKKFLALFRTGKLGPVILDDVPDPSDSVS